MPRKIEEITIAGARIPVVELTTAQVDEMLVAMEAGFDLTRLDKLMLPQKHIPEFALNMMTDPVKINDLVTEHDLAPSQYATVYDKAAEVNSFLFQALQMYREKSETISNLQRAITTMAGSGVPPST